MFDNASKSQLPRLISLLHGHVASLLRHSVGFIVVEHAYEMGNAAQKREFLMELYSTELQLFKDLANIKENKTVDIISKIGLKKLSVLRHMTCVIQPISEKGIRDLNRERELRDVFQRLESDLVVPDWKETRMEVAEAIV